MGGKKGGALARETYSEARMRSWNEGGIVNVQKTMLTQEMAGVSESLRKMPRSLELAGVDDPALLRRLQELTDSYKVLEKDLTAAIGDFSPVLM